MVALHKCLLFGTRPFRLPIALPIVYSSSVASTETFFDTYSNSSKVTIEAFFTNQLTVNSLCFSKRFYARLEQLAKKKLRIG